MSSGIGAISKAGIKREALVYTKTWPGVPIAVDAVLPLLTGGTLDEHITFAPNNTTDGDASPLLPDKVGVGAGGVLPIPLQYETCDAWVSLAMGYMPFRKGGASGGVTMPELIASGVYKHIHEVDIRLADRAWRVGEGGWKVGDGLICGQQLVRRATIAQNKTVAVDEFRSIMVKGFTLKASRGGVRIDLDTIGYDLDMASSTNTTGVLDALSFGSEPFAQFDQCVVRIGAASPSTPLGSGDEIVVDDLVLTVANQLIDDQRDVYSGMNIVQPERSGKVAVSGTFRLPRYTSTAQRTRLQAATELMADIKFTGGQIAATGNNYQFNLYIPTVTLTSAPAAVRNAGAINHPLSWTAGLEPAARAGFPTNETGGAIIIETQGANANHPLL